MDSRWLKGYTGKAREERIKEVKSFTHAFSELEELLKGLQEDTKADYDCPSWSHKQADINGANRKLREMLSLLNTKD